MGRRVTPVKMKLEAAIRRNWTRRIAAMAMRLARPLLPRA
jgi:hypothetical protein